jgi:hypothetical protein
MTEYPKWTREKMREYINGVCEHIDEWDNIIGDDPKGDLADFQNVIRDINWALSKFSFSLIANGIEAAEPCEIVDFRD